MYVSFSKRKRTLFANMERCHERRGVHGVVCCVTPSGRVYMTTTPAVNGEELDQQLQQQYSTKVPPASGWALREVHGFLHGTVTAQACAKAFVPRDKTIDKMMRQATELHAKTGCGVFLALLTLDCMVHSLATGGLHGLQDSAALTFLFRDTLRDLPRQQCVALDT